MNLNAPVLSCKITVDVTHHIFNGEDATVSLIIGTNFLDFQKT